MHPTGRILRKRMLGTDATYRVVDDDGSTVTVEVVDAPGLTPGFRMALNADDARAMETVAESAEAPSQRRGSARSPAPGATHDPRGSDGS